MKKVLSLIQPTGALHLGNYSGAIQNWTKLQNKYSCKFGIADLHTLTMPFKKETLNKNSKNMLLDLVACGIDPEKSSLFVQSWVPEHCELYWIFSCICGFGDLSRMTQFKDKSSQVKSSETSISLGLFSYPVLQAADILIYKADYVPVGKDQLQHLELTRRIARKFNHSFSECFPVPEPLISIIPNLLSLADPSKKMSKSLGSKHYIGLFENEQSISKKVRSAVTDAGQNSDSSAMSEGVENLFGILLICDCHKEHGELLAEYNHGTLKYGKLKEAVIFGIIRLTKGFIERRMAIEETTDEIFEIVLDNSRNNRRIAKETLKEVKDHIGLM